MTHAPTARAVLLAVVVAVAAAACSGPGDGGPATSPTPSVDAATEAPETPAPPPDLSAFAAVDRATWSAIDQAPVESAGRQVVVFAVVSRVYTAAEGAVAVHIATAQPAGPTEGTPAMLRGDPPSVLAEVASGDVLRVYAEVLGAYAGRTGQAVLLPELRVVAVEAAGPYDAAADVAFGAAEWGATSVVLPVTVTNSADTTLEYRVELVARSADGTAELDTARPRIGVLEPGQSVTSDVRFALLPTDATISLASVTRSLPVPG